MSDIHAETFSFSAYLADILTTKEVRESVDSVATRLINQWGAESLSKKMASGTARWAIKKTITPSNNSTQASLSELLKKPENISQTAFLMTTITDVLADILFAATEQFEAMDEAKKLEFLSGLFSSADPERTGKIITGLSRSLDSLYKSNPELFNEKIKAAFEVFIQNTDFSALKDLFEHSQIDISKILTGINELFFSYPAKLVTLLSFLPGVSNLLVTYLEDLFSRFNELPPDILTDIVLSLFKEVDEKGIGQLFNQFNEFVRKLHTGSALIGDAGAPYFSTVLLNKIRGVLDETDPALLLTAGNGLVDGKETLIKTFQTALGENPELLKTYLGQITSGRNSRIRLLKHKLEIIENLSESEAAEALAAGLSSWNAYDLAEVVNSAAIILNTLNEFSPELLENLISEFTGTLDLGEIELLFEASAKGAFTPFKPVLRTVLPDLLTGLIECFATENDGNDEKIEQARLGLRKFIMGDEVKDG